ncbi:UNVERIFIED_CONTAM: hypothetical protein GTU68_004982, partial [Idotea baltica]|nr:hypothetical protein [Idotea baltica]
KLLIAVLGPTAVGKTATSLKLARTTGSEIISCDSRQFFKGLPIGTAQPTEEELAIAKHHFIAFLNITDNYSAGMFETDALKTIQLLHEKDNAVVFTGGSGLYVSAVLTGLDDVPPKDELLRKELENKLENEGITFLQEQLKGLDAEYFEKVDVNNPRRLIRGIEVVKTTGKSILSFQNKPKTPRPFTAIKIGLERNREELYDRINLRVDLMFKAGLLDEAKKMYPFKNYNALQTVGYNELFDFFDGKHDLAEATRLIKRNSRRYAKRQLTWLRKQDNITWFHPDNIDGIAEFVSMQMNHSK